MVSTVVSGISFSTVNERWLGLDLGRLCIPGLGMVKSGRGRGMDS